MNATTKTKMYARTDADARSNIQQGRRGGEDGEKGGGKGAERHTCSGVLRTQMSVKPTMSEKNTEAAAWEVERTRRPARNSGKSVISI
jgi:hypothetical protein